MKQQLIITALLCISLYSAAQSGSSSSGLPEGAKLVFNNTKTKLNDKEKADLFQQLHLTISKDKKELMMEDFPVQVRFFPVDLNGDGVEEVFIEMNSSALFGNIGQNYLLFIKSGGKYAPDGNVTGGIPMILADKASGYPDIILGGPGMEFPRYKWSGGKYACLRSIKDSELEKLKPADVESLSKSYTSALK